MAPTLVEAVNALQSERIAERAEKDAQIKQLNDRISNLERVIEVLMARALKE